MLTYNEEITSKKTMKLKV